MKALSVLIVLVIVTATWSYPKRLHKSQSKKKGFCKKTLTVPSYDIINNQSHEINDINRNSKFTLVEGDILVPGFENGGLHRSKRQAIVASAKSLWNKTAIPYAFDKNLGDQKISVIRNGIAFWQSHTCLNFVENAFQFPHLNFIEGDGCYSYVGRLVEFSRIQNISIGRGCENLGTVTHEIAHSLGFLHTQSRADRDKYVEIMVDNIIHGYEENFEKASPGENNNFNLPYDYGSVMHYSDDSFSKSSSKPTIMSLSTLSQRTMGSRLEPSFIDVKMMNTLYNCSDACKDAPKLACRNGGYQSPATCTECLCPFGFGGITCNKHAEGRNVSKTCGGILYATNSWQSFTASIGDGQSNVKEDFDMCAWFVQAETGRRVELVIRSVTQQCTSGCFYGGVEFKIKDFELTGYRFCCNEDVTNAPTMISVSNKAIIIGYSRLNRQNMEVLYRQIEKTKVENEEKVSDKCV